MWAKVLKAHNLITKVLNKEWLCTNQFLNVGLDSSVSESFARLGSLFMLKNIAWFQLIFPLSDSKEAQLWFCLYETILF